MDETKEELNTIPTIDYQFPSSCHEQFIEHIQGKLPAPSPTWFYKRELYDRLGGCDEHYRLFDDYPFAFRMLESGEHFSYMPQVTVLYRVTNISVSNSKQSTGKQKQPYFESRLAAYYELQVPALKKNKLWGRLIYNNLFFLFYKKKIYSNDDSFSRYFYGALCLMLNLLLPNKKQKKYF